MFARLFFALALSTSTASAQEPLTRNTAFDNYIDAMVSQCTPDEFCSPREAKEVYESTWKRCAKWSETVEKLQNEAEPELVLIEEAQTRFTWCTKSLYSIENVIVHSYAFVKKVEEPKVTAPPTEVLPAQSTPRKSKSSPRRSTASRSTTDPNRVVARSR
ncbi:hypothetical protein KW798_01310 [Candidatus Parcubacteria bacterium]|nr:hypothetical protein [Candidatus Parcubacteria bacterium]